MTFDPRVEPFLQHYRQRLVQRIGHVDRRRMMIDSRPATRRRAAARIIFPQHRHIEIPRLHLRLARIHDRKGPLAETHGRKSRRATQTLLRAAEDCIDPPLVHAQLMSAQTRDRIDHQQRPARVHEVRKSRERLMRPGARLRVHDRHELRLRMGIERCLDLLE